MESEAVLQTLALAIFLGILAQFVASKLKLPSIIFLMLFGIVAGPEVLHLLHSRELTDIISALISVGVAIILFEGGMTLNIQDLKSAPRAIVNIIVFGPFITMATIAVCLHYILDLNWGISALTGAILTVSGPTVVTPLLARVRVDRKLKEVLNWESIIVDAVGATLMVVTLHFVLSASESHLTTIGHFLGRLALGVVTGYLTGKLLLFIVPRKIIAHEHLNIAILGIILFAYWGSNHIASESGLLTVTIAGLMLGQLRHPVLEEIKGFKEQLSTLTVSVLFILLASRIDLGNITEYGWPMALAVLSILFVARPLMIFLTTLKTRLNLREKLFLVWIAPRGIIAAATASLFTIILTANHYPQAAALESIVFLIIICTVVLQGLTAAPMAQLLKVTAPPRNGYLLVGVHRFSIALAKLLQQEDVPVKLIDNKEDKIIEAKEAGLDVSCGNIMDEEVLEKIGLERIGTMLALTESDETNTLVCRLGRKLLGIDSAFQVVNTFFSDITDEVLLNFGGQLAFEMKISIKTVNERLENGRLKVEKVNLRKTEKGFELPENFLFPLFFLKKGRVTVAKEDDRITTPNLIAITIG